MIFPAFFYQLILSIPDRTRIYSCVFHKSYLGNVFPVPFQSSMTVTLVLSQPLGIRYWSVSQSTPLNEYQLHLTVFSYVPEHDLVVCDTICDIQVYLWILRCGNVVHFTIRFFEAEKFTNLRVITLSLLSWRTHCILLSVWKYSLFVHCIKDCNNAMNQQNIFLTA